MVRFWICGALLVVGAYGAYDNGMPFPPMDDHPGPPMGPPPPHAFNDDNYYRRPEISQARIAIERASDYIRENFIDSLMTVSNSTLASQNNLTDSVNTVVRQLRRNPEQIHDVLPQLPRIIALDGQKQVLEIMRIMSEHGFATTNQVRDAIEVLTDSLGGLGTRHHYNRNGDYRDGYTNSLGLPNIFGGFNGVFRNMMDSVYTVARPYNNNGRWKKR